MEQKARFVRLVEVTRAPASHVSTLLVAALLAVLLLSGLPWTWDNIDAARTYVDPTVKRGFLAFGAAVLLMCLIVIVAQIAVAVGASAVLYGRVRKGRCELAGPLGVLGYRRQVIRLSGDLAVAVESESIDHAAAPFLHFGPQHLRASQGARSIHVSSVARIDVTSLEILRGWLVEHGLTAHMTSRRAQRQEWFTGR